MASAEELSTEPSGRIQWLPECDDCDNPAEHYCKTCQEKLCTGCKADHLSKQKKRHHTFVPYSAENNQEPKLESCLKHPEQRYEMFCKPCSTPVCIICIVESHFGDHHSFIKIKEIYETCKKAATGRLETLKSEIKSTLETAIEDTINIVENTKQKMKSRHKYIQQCLDEILDENMTELDNTCQEQLLPYQKKLSSIDRSIQEYVNHLYSDSPVKLINFMENRSMDQEINIAHLPTIKTNCLVFETGNDILKEKLKSQFGQLKSLGTNANRNGDHETGLYERKMQMSWAADYSSQNNAKVQFLDHPVRLKKFTTQCGKSSLLCKITCDGKDRAWIHGGEGDGIQRKIKQIDRTGRVTHHGITTWNIYNSTGMVISKDGDLLISDKDHNCVQKISGDSNATSLFTNCQSGPRGMCVSPSGDVAVCLLDLGLLKIYDSKGKMLKELGAGYLARPHHVAFNKVNNNYIVSDNDTRVVVFSSSGEYRFTYNGHDVEQKITPRDLCIDCKGNILITDLMNHCVHILDKDGRFLRYLVSGKDHIVSPWSIDIDDEGFVWVGEYFSRSVLVFKYLK